MSYYKFNNYELLLLYRYMEIYNIEKVIDTYETIIKDFIEDDELYDLILDKYPDGFTKEDILRFDGNNDIEGSDTFFDRVKELIQVKKERSKFIYFINVGEYKELLAEYLQHMHGITRFESINRKINDYTFGSEFVIGIIEFRKINRKYALIDNIDLGIVTVTISDDQDLFKEVFTNMIYQQFIDYIHSTNKSIKILIDRKYADVVVTPNNMKIRDVSLPAELQQKFSDRDIVLIESSRRLYETWTGDISADQFNTDVNAVFDNIMDLKDFCKKYQDHLYKFVDHKLFKSIFDEIKLASIRGGYHVFVFAHLDILFNTISEVTPLDVAGLDNLAVGQNLDEQMNFIKNVKNGFLKMTMFYAMHNLLDIEVEMNTIWRYLKPVATDAIPKNSRLESDWTHNMTALINLLIKWIPITEWKEFMKWFLSQKSYLPQEFLHNYAELFDLARNNENNWKDVMYAFEGHLLDGREIGYTFISRFPLKYFLKLLTIYGENKIYNLIYVHEALVRSKSSTFLKWWKEGDWFYNSEIRRIYNTYGDEFIPEYKNIWNPVMILYTHHPVFNEDGDAVGYEFKDYNALKLYRSMMKDRVDEITRNDKKKYMGLYNNNPVLDYLLKQKPKIIPNDIIEYDQDSDVSELKSLRKGDEINLNIYNFLNKNVKNYYSRWTGMQRLVVKGTNHVYILGLDGEFIDEFKQIIGINDLNNFTQRLISNNIDHYINTTNHPSIDKYTLSIGWVRFYIFNNVLFIEEIQSDIQQLMRNTIIGLDWISEMILKNFISWVYENFGMDIQIVMPDYELRSSNAYYKGREAKPPKSIYSKLPKMFGFKHEDMPNTLKRSLVRSGGKNIDDAKVYILENKWKVKKDIF